MSVHITLNSLTERDGEPRVLDTALAVELGMAQPLNVRPTIRKHRAELELYGLVSTASVETSARGGRPGRAYYLNEPQALLLCMWSNTPTAAAVRKQLIEVFMAWRVSRQQQQSAPTIPVKAHERRTSTRIDAAISLARSADRLEAVAARAEPVQASLAWVNNQPVAYDAAEYKLHGQDAVVLYQDGRMAVERVDYFDRHDTNQRAGLGEERLVKEWGNMRTRPGVTILGRVLGQQDKPAKRCLTLGSLRPSRPANNNGTRHVYRDAILSCLANGMTAREIVEQTGASIWTVQKWQKKRRHMAA